MLTYFISFLCSTRTVEHTYDWVNFIVGAPPASSFNVPAYCRPGAAPSTPPIPTASALGAPSADVPPLPSQFTATLEAKLGHQDGAQFVTDSFRTLAWSLDAERRVERFDMYMPSEPNEPDSPVVVRSLVYVYAPNTTWGAHGTVFQAQLDHDSSTYTGCTMMPISAVNQSPLMRLRAGFTPLLFAEHGRFNASEQTYLGRVGARGVVADTFRSHHRIENSNTVFEFDSDVYFFPLGWSFPGRGGANETALPRMPLRVRNEGRQTSADGSFVAYVDEWDVFLLRPGAPPAYLFEPQALGCVPPPPTAAPAAPPQDASAGTIIFAATLGSLVGIALAAGAAAYYFKRWRAENPKGAEPVPLVNVNIEGAATANENEEGL